MQYIIEEIQKANADAIEDLLKAVLARYRVLYPDWEVSTVSVLKSEDRNEQLDRIIEMLEKMKTFPSK